MVKQQGASLLQVVMISRLNYGVLEGLRMGLLIQWGAMLAVLSDFALARVRSSF